MLQSGCHTTHALLAGEGQVAGASAGWRHKSAGGGHEPLCFRAHNMFHIVMIGGHWQMASGRHDDGKGSAETSTNGFLSLNQRIIFIKPLVLDVFVDAGQVSVEPPHGAQILMIQCELAI